MIGDLFKESETLSAFSTFCDCLKGFGLVLCVIGGAVLIAGLLTRRMKP